jgi:hypothetical protein
MASIGIELSRVVIGLHFDTSECVWFGPRSRGEGFDKRQVGTNVVRTQACMPFCRFDTN